MGHVNLRVTIVFIDGVEVVTEAAVLRAVERNPRFAAYWGRIAMHPSGGGGAGWAGLRVISKGVPHTSAEQKRD